jgi:hypothetical protein
MEKQPSIYEIAKSRIERLQHNMAIRREKISALVDEDKIAVQHLLAWQTIMDSEKPNDVAIGQAPSPPTLTPVSVNFAAAPYPPEQTIEGYGQRAALVREMLQAAQLFGLTPKEIKDRLTEMGIAVSASFAGNALSRMKASGEVVERDGRYFWAAKSRYTVEVKQVEPANKAGS